MNFIVYRNIEGSIPQIIANTLFLEDAKTVLSNWNSGYVTNREGDLLFSK